MNQPDDEVKYLRTQLQQKTSENISLREINFELKKHLNYLINAPLPELSHEVSYRKEITASAKKLIEVNE